MGSGSASLYVEDMLTGDSVTISRYWLALRESFFRVTEPDGQASETQKSKSMIRIDQLNKNRLLSIISPSAVSI